MPIGISQIDFIDWYKNKEKKCYYCGRVVVKMTIERKDNKQPYSLSNIELACEECNKVKSNILTEKEMFIIGKLIMSKR